MTTLDERYEEGQAMRAELAAGDLSHFTLPGTDQLAPDLTRIIDEALLGSIWTRPGLDLKKRCICTVSALMALGQLPLLRRDIERCLNVGLNPEQVVEVFIQMTFYVGFPAVEAALSITKEIFEERGIQFTPTQVYDTKRTVGELYNIGVQSRHEHMGDIAALDVDNEALDSLEIAQRHLIDEYHWGAIYTRPHLDATSRATCALSAMAVLGRYDRQIRIRIEGAIRVGVTPSEILEIFNHLMLYGGFYITRTANRIARSVFTEQGLSV